MEDDRNNGVNLIRRLKIPEDKCNLFYNLNLSLVFCFFNFSRKENLFFLIKVALQCVSFLLYNEVNQLYVYIYASSVLDFLPI